MRHIGFVPVLAVAMVGMLAAAEGRAAEDRAPPPAVTALEEPEAEPADMGLEDEWLALELGPGPGGLERGPAGRRMGARRGPGPMGSGGSSARQELREALKLTDAQREKLADIREREARRRIEARARLGIAMLDLRKLLRGDKPDRNAVDQQIDRVAQLRAEAQKGRIAAMLESRELLTAEQRKLLRERGGMEPGFGPLWRRPMRHGPGFGRGSGRTDPERPGDSGGE